MSEKVHFVRCGGCGLPIGEDGLVLRKSKGDGYFYTMRQVREAAKNHRWFCTNYTGDFGVKASWDIEVSA
jgi:hypothetical protein